MIEFGAIRYNHSSGEGGGRNADGPPGPESPAPESVGAGRQLGPYRFIELLASGGMGDVYRAEDTRLERMIAIKVLPSELAGDAERRVRFEREAKALAALDHPHVVTVHSVEEIEGVHVLVMELVKGRTLEASIRAGGVEVGKLLEIAVQMTRGVAAAHSVGIVHRDLKPANVMIDSGGGVKILDFGLAKQRFDTSSPDATRQRTEVITEQGRVLGTAAYMSPEQVNGEPADERSDVFALGVILYEMATGVRPFRGDSWAEIGSSIIRDTPPSITDLRRDLPDHLGRIVRRCLDKDPGRRYRSAVDLCNELEDLARELDAASVTSSADVAAPRRPRSGWRIAAIAGAVLAVMLLAWWGLNRDPGGDPAEPGVASSIRSVAVLPFENLGGNPEDEFLIEGMLDALITELSKTDLTVIGRGSAMRFREIDRSPSEIAAELGVGGVLEGSVLRVDDRVRVSARLVHGPRAEYVWGESYDRELSDILVLTAEVARAVATEVALVVTPDQARRLGRARRVDPRAWELYARGLHHLNQFTQAEFAEARRLFREAVDIAPDFAEAWGGLGYGYGAAAATGGVPDPELVSGAWRALDRALELDPDLADVHAGMGHGHLTLEWDWEAAERELRIALDLKPNSSLARHGYADLLALQGRLEESVEQARLGRQYDPLSPIAVLPHVAHLVLARRYDEAIAEYQRARRQIPELPEAFVWVADAYWGSGRFEEAVEEYAAVLRRSGEAGIAEALREGFERGGPREAARAFIARAQVSDDGSLALATWYARAGDASAALDWLERAYEVHIPTLPVILRREDFDLVRSDPRYEALTDRLGVPR